ncbi:MAG: zinc ribbon domain-containing protein [Chloroflexi bacterium]|nr:zinc ribbon domain-containing protein [Chloroflexota bacterium]MBU1749273.1 zinc ribbon domain-containing protein [Chloroflexota bacterium]MBU1878363.1 zinc ribbon domain-containing protein [Chloroflexota bacterium]
MPIYEYRCSDCRTRFSLLVYGFEPPEGPACKRCGGHHTSRLISRVSVVRSEETRIDDLSDPGMLDGVDENDPRSIARWMRKMSDGMGEDMGPEFDEIIGRMEAGEDMESIEQRMEELGLGDEMGPGGMDGMGMGGGYDPYNFA